MKTHQKNSLGFNWQLLKTKIRFVKKHGYWPNISEPVSFNEKIQWRKFYGNQAIYILCADKYAVRDYVKSKVGEQYLIPLLDCVETVEQLKFDQYGTNFVVKSTHSSGGVFLCQKGLYDPAKVVKGLTKVLKADNGKKRNEPWYSAIQPKVIVEEMLIDSSGKPPADYKFHIFNQAGKIHYFLHVDYDREAGHHRSIYDESGDLLNLKLKKPNLNTQLEQLENFPEMLKVAKQLAEDFSYVRVDLYNVNGRIYFGELTFAHGSGFERFSPRKYDYEWGALWSLT